MENTLVPKINLTSKIREIKLKECKIAETVPTTLVHKLEKEKIQFESNFNVRVDIVQKTIIINLRTNFFADEAKTIPLGHIATEGIFDIVNLDELLASFQGKLPEVVYANFIGILIGTTRGLLITCSKGTIMEGCYFPMIQPHSLFPNME